MILQRVPVYLTVVSILPGRAGRGGLRPMRLPPRAASPRTVRVKVNASSKSEGVRMLEEGYYQVRTRAGP